MSSSSTKKVPPQLERYRFSLDEYHELVASGFFKREDRIELIEGELIMMPPPSPERSAQTSSLRELIERLLPAELHLRVADPITVPPDSEPEPDFCVVKRRADFYKSGHPKPKDVRLIVEVSKTSAAFDTGQKARIYGAAGIPEYWVIEIEQRVVHVFTEPTKNCYRTQQTYRRDDRVQCGTIRKLALKVVDMLL